MREDLRRDVPATSTGEFGAEDRIANLQISERLRRVVGHEHRGIPSGAINAAMFAAPVWVDGLAEADVGRLVAADDRTRGLRQHDGLALLRLFIFVPAVVLESLREDVETAGRL